MQGIACFHIHLEGFVACLERQLPILGDHGGGGTIEDPFLTACLCQLIDDDVVLTIGGTRLALHLQNGVVFALGNVDGAFVESTRGTQLVENIGESRDGGFELTYTRQSDLGTVLLGDNRLLQLGLFGLHTRRDHIFKLEPRPRACRGYCHTSSCLST
ncbi:hypothetical protein D3C71_1555600 [compost metagenome]